MATEGKTLLTAAGKRNLGPSSKKRLGSGGTDTCACVSCFDLAGPATCQVTIAAASTCFTGCDGVNGGILGSAISGTWTLTRYTGNVLGPCYYEGTFPYTGVVAILYNSATGCVTEICRTTHIKIWTWNNGGSDWSLKAELFNPAVFCDCNGDTVNDVGFLIMDAFFKVSYTMAVCGATVTGTLDSSCVTTFSTGTCPEGFAHNAGFYLTHGGTFTVTI